MTAPPPHPSGKIGEGEGGLYTGYLNDDLSCLPQRTQCFNRF